MLLLCILVVGFGVMVGWGFLFRLIWGLVLVVILFALTSALVCWYWIDYYLCLVISSDADCFFGYCVYLCWFDSCVVLLR